MADRLSPNDPNVQIVDVRLYFDKEENREELLDNISDTLQDSPMLAALSAAYELRNDGFGHLVQYDQEPLA